MSVKDFFKKNKTYMITWMLNDPLTFKTSIGTRELMTKNTGMDLFYEAVSFVHQTIPDATIVSIQKLD